MNKLISKIKDWAGDFIDYLREQPTAYYISAWVIVAVLSAIWGVLQGFSREAFYAALTVGVIIIVAIEVLDYYTLFDKIVYFARAVLAVFIVLPLLVSIFIATATVAIICKALYEIYDTVRKVVLGKPFEMPGYQQVKKIVVDTVSVISRI